MSKSFKKSSHYYDLIYSWKEYKKETVKIKSLIKQHKKSDGNDLLEVACGTGKHLQHLKDSFSILATDINKDMLVIAQKNVPDITFKQANMIQLNVGKKFDIILCLFSSIGYIKTYKNLSKTIKNFSEHLKKGGIVIIEPWFAESFYHTGVPTMTTYDGKDIKIARLCVCKKQGMLSIMDMHYLIAERNQKIHHFIEKHELAMFATDKMIKIMEENRLKTKFLKNGLMKDRGLYINGTTLTHRLM